MFENLLKDKKILLGVSASISIYKSLELIRLFVKSGAQVRVVMSESAKKFISPLSFETLSMHKVLHSDTESWDNDLNHIKIGEWADVFVIAPASANTIAKLSSGISDNLLLQTALAYPREKLLCPAANTHMIHNPIISHSMKMLALANYTIMNTQTKLLACNTKGDGALIDIEEIYFKTSQILLKEDFWTNRSAIVTAGGSIEKIDDVRYLSNYSSGKMGSSLALALFFKGADVSIIASRFSQRLPETMTQMKFESSIEMKEHLNNSVSTAVTKTKSSTIEKEPFVFMAAAVADYIPSSTKQGKLKKSDIGESWSLDLKQNEDLLLNLNKTGIKAIGFKAEMDKQLGLANAKAMLKNKGLNAVCYNLLKDASSFGTNDNAIEFITSAFTKSLTSKEKLLLSFEVLELCKSL
ncbi:bifunctional phosphopantothenoylcysteine decarboxylase/phosphopantothenate--cysteine ligase CoaBC [Sulfurimonas sp. MAG313]|nr:bifunctional phosphopantothenoylcysteine decarboxylase/phosphopantothenate--cysteine ligase CoaBC [Sulfurimonas sp. MAG313]MDF1879792.1 bifunctional phosphopantothenoylcysteine decarboxylase/phosphopantothenate--cysteine ligase CoaBC [Sulfurimonas sp. MAG313]